MKLITLRLYFTIFIVLLAVITLWALPVRASGLTKAWHQGFEHDSVHAKTYYHSHGGAQAKLQVIKGDAAKGSYYFQATLPGKRLLEGFHIRANGLQSGRITTVSVKMRGSGKIMIALMAGDGWSYSEHLTLTNNWETYKVSRTMRPSDKTLGIFFISPMKRQPNVVFDVDDVRVLQAPPMKLYNTAVGAWRLNAINFASPKFTKTLETNKVVVGSKRFTLTDIPFPRTSSPVVIHLHVKGKDAKIRLRTTIAYSRPQTIRTTSSGKSSSWHWIHFKPVMAAEVGNSFNIDIKPAKDKKLVIDEIVLTSRSNLNNRQLNNAKTLFPSAPLTTAARIINPPAIDGEGNDPCWKHTVAVKDFMVFGTHTPPAQPTTVRLAYDAKNLYVIAHCTEPLLEIAAQSQSELVAKATKPDGKVLRDDSFLIFIRPNPSTQTVYEFSVNTLGTLLDVKEMRSDLWNTRNIKWDSHAKVAVKKGDGYWALEMAIPLKDLGVSSINPDSNWRIGLDRVARGRKEFSSWQPTNSAGAHAPIELGILKFVSGPLGITPEHGLTVLKPGKNIMPVKLGKNTVANGANLTTSLLNQKTRSHQITFAQEPGTISHAVKVKQQGDTTVRWAVLSAGTLEPFYISPKLSLMVRTSHLPLTISAPGDYQVQVNGENVASGSHATNRRISLGLRKGINVISVISKAGTAKLSIDTPWMKRFDRVWRSKPLTQSKKIGWKTDDRNWKIAKSDVDGTFGTKGEPTLFRKTVLVGYTNIWPVPKPAYYIAGNTTQMVTFTAPGIKGKMLNHWTTYLAVPQGLKVMGATGHYAVISYQPHFNSTRIGTTMINGATMSLYKIEASKPLGTGHADVMSKFEVMFQIANPKDAREGRSWKLYYWSQANNGTMVEAPRSFEMKALPPVHGIQPKEFVLEVWGALTRIDKHVLGKMLVKTSANAGFNLINSPNIWAAKAGDKYGIKVEKNVQYRTWSINLKPFLDKHPEARLISFDGKPNNKQMCMSLRLGKDWPVVAKQFMKTIKKYDPDVVMYDYEVPPFTGSQSCYDQRCLTAFRQYSHLSENIKLTPEIIKSDYKDQWYDFMAWRVAELSAKMKKVVHENFPNKKFAMYSGYQMPSTVKRYGINWKYITKLDATDYVKCGYGRSVKRLNSTLQAANGTPVVLGIIVRPYRVSVLKPIGVITEAKLLRRALDATGGLLVYSLPSMDGRSWRNVASISRLIAKYENLFYGHGLNDLKAISGQSPAKVSVISIDGTSLVCVMNTSSKPNTFSFQLPAALGSGQGFYSGKPVSAGAAIHRTLQPGGVAVYVLQHR